MLELAPGTLIAGCRIEALAGTGGWAVVYRARHLVLEREVAVKVIAPEHAQDPRFRARFVRESRVAAAIDHPHVIRATTPASTRASCI
jgi:serine/threonine protein kinase